MDAFHYVPDRIVPSPYTNSGFKSSRHAWELIKTVTDSNPHGTASIKGVTFTCTLASDKNGFYLEPDDNCSENLGHDLFAAGLRHHTWYSLEFLPDAGSFPDTLSIVSRRGVVEGLSENPQFGSRARIRLHTFDIIHDSTLEDGESFCVIRSRGVCLPNMTSHYEGHIYHLYSNQDYGGCYILHTRNCFPQHDIISFDDMSDHLSLMYRMMTPVIGTYSDYVMTTYNHGGQTRTRISASYPFGDDIPFSRRMQPIRTNDFFSRIVRFTHEKKEIALLLSPPLHIYSSNNDYYTGNFLSAFMCLEGMVTALAQPDEIHLSAFEIEKEAKDAVFYIIGTLQKASSSQKDRLRNAIKDQVKGKPRQNAANLIYNVLRRLNADTSTFSRSDVEHLCRCRNSVAHTTRLDHDRYNFGGDHIEEIARRIIDSLFCAVINYQGGLLPRHTPLSMYVEDPQIVL